MAELCERRVDKPGAILTRVQVPGAARNFASRFNFRCRLSYGGRTTCCVQSHASASVHILKILNIGITSCEPVWPSGKALGR